MEVLTLVKRGVGHDISRPLVIGINASPRSSGNSAAALAEIIAGVSSAGLETRAFHLGVRGPLPCQGCLSCEDTGRCAQRDLDEMMAALVQASGLIVATPVYLGHVPAQFKAFIDRCRCLISFAEAVTARGEQVWGLCRDLYLQSGHMPKPVRRLPEGKRAVLVMTYFQPGKRRFPRMTGYLKDWCETLGITVERVVKVDNVVAPGDLAARDGEMRKLRRAGASLAKSLQEGMKIRPATLLQGKCV